ncbi:hypothetical protein N7517_007568 [Penicillium concentricum]|uniref:Carboxylic ester hydrolase n=1 Tax=Penicillium concentricum TaxID=293559 RepID=A0A9W9SBF3_9EURO|nr:uncharacterized protein N7517_007568 [Penicillium concentricum]KAJ5375562.1 hypothetical protein N7517_007568 [Penicillium concentricum]
MHFSQFGTLFYLLAPVSGIALRPYGGVPHPRAVSSAPLSSASVSATRVVGFAVAAPTTISNPEGSDLNLASLWTSAQCDQHSIDDATVAFADRWYAAGVPGAWNTMLGEWMNGAKDGMYRGLEFPAFVSWFFHGPEQWNCKNVGGVPCSSVVQCKDVDHPAGEIYNALDTAMLETQSKIGEFSSIFAPQSDNTKIILAIFDGLTMMMGFSVSAFFSIAEKDIAKIAKGATTARVSIPRNREAGTEGPLPAPEIQEYPLETFERTEKALTGSPMEFNGKAYANDMSYQLYGITAAFTRNNAPT